MGGPKKIHGGYCNCRTVSFTMGCPVERTLLRPQSQRTVMRQPSRYACDNLCACVEHKGLEMWHLHVSWCMVRRLKSMRLDFAFLFISMAPHCFQKHFTP